RRRACCSRPARPRSRPGSSRARPTEGCADNRRMFRIVLVAPELPPTTGNVIRLAANTGCELHLVEPLGFSMEDKLLQRAGLDYHEHARVQRHASWSDFMQCEQPAPDRTFAFTTRGKRKFNDVAWTAGDWL